VRDGWRLETSGYPIDLQRPLSDMYANLKWVKNSIFVESLSSSMLFAVVSSSIKSVLPLLFVAVLCRGVLKNYRSKMRNLLRSRRLGQLY
jgi:hypothetical protein